MDTTIKYGLIENIINKKIIIPIIAKIGIYLLSAFFTLSRAIKIESIIKIPHNI